jgi:hypothetical protein
VVAADVEAEELATEAEAGTDSTNHTAVMAVAADEAVEEVAVLAVAEALDVEE